MKETTQEEGWVICKVFKKKIHFHDNASDDCDNNYSIMDSSTNSKLDNLTSTMHEIFAQLPPQKNSVVESVPTDWATLDKLVALQLNGKSPTPLMQIDSFDEQSCHDVMVPYGAFEIN